MNIRQLLVGFGTAFVGIGDVIFFRGLTQDLGDVAILLGAATVVWGLLADPPEDPIRESMPDPLPGRLCDRCGKITSLDVSTCEHCGAPLIETGSLLDPPESSDPPR